MSLSTEAAATKEHEANEGIQPQPNVDNPQPESSYDPYIGTSEFSGSRLYDWYYKAHRSFASNYLSGMAAKACERMPGVKSMNMDARKDIERQMVIWLSRLLYFQKFREEFTEAEKALIVKELTSSSALISIALIRSGAFEGSDQEPPPLLLDLIDSLDHFDMEDMYLPAGVDLDDQLRQAITPFPTRGHRERSAIEVDGDFVDVPMPGKGQLPEPISTENKRTRFLPCQTPSVRSAAARGSA